MKNSENNRPSSKEIETYLSIFKLAMKEYIKEYKEFNYYVKLSKTEKNKKFAELNE